jgi:phospholipase/lecithinase/hemolysin
LAAEATIIGEYNYFLSQTIDQFTSSNTDAKAWLVDTQDPFNVVLDNYDAFGYANATCYDADGVTCPWWNNYHPAMEIHDFVASAFASTVGGPWSAKGGD